MDKYAAYLQAERQSLTFIETSDLLREVELVSIRVSRRRVYLARLLPERRVLGIDLSPARESFYGQRRLLFDTDAERITVFESEFEAASRERTKPDGFVTHIRTARGAIIVRDSGESALMKRLMAEREAQ